jgi:pilus assembly protein CpaC
LNKTPGIASVPILGELFKSKNNNHSVDELVVIVTATVINPLQQDTAPKLPKEVLPDLGVEQFDKSVAPAPKAATKP